jgi:hypothetical protein
MFIGMQFMVSRVKKDGEHTLFTLKPLGLPPNIDSAESCWFIVEGSLAFRVNGAPVLKEGEVLSVEMARARAVA